MIDDFTTPGDAETWPQRGRGGWLRNFKGDALVSHPLGHNKKLAYGGGSSFYPGEPYSGDPIHGERGTHVHDITDLACRGLPLDDEFIARGVELGIGAELQAYIYARWIVFRKTHNLTTLHIEYPYVNDAWRVASNIDRVDLVDGHIVFGDTKSARSYTKPEYVAQLSTMPDGIPYDVDTEERGEWSHPINRRHAHIFHFPIGAAIDAGDKRDEWPDWTLVRVDLVIASDLGHHIAKVKFDVTHKEAFTIAAPAIGSFVAVEQPTGGVAAPPVTLEALREKARQLGLNDGEFTVRLREYFDANDTDRNDPGQVDEAIRAVVNFADVDVEPVPRPTTPAAATVAPKVIDEGATITDADLAAAGGRYGRLTDVQRSWVSVCGGRVRLSPDHGGLASVRRFELLQALCTLAEGGFDDDDTVRAIAAHTSLGDAVWQSVAAVDVIAGLGLDDAKRFSRIADVVATGGVAMNWTLDRRLVISPTVVEKAVAA